MRDLQAQHPETSISMKGHKTSVKQEDGQSRAFYRCGSLQHLANKCRFASEKCHKCGKQGHILKVCRSKTSLGEPNFQGCGRRKRGGQRMHYVSRDEKSASASDEEGIFIMYSLQETEILKVAVKCTV